ncbi:MAG TPA: PAS domain S-box protein, partial [Candidatus Caenarcaniphilales bacterium]
NITERKRAQEALQQAHDELELRVQERTAELAKTNEDLRAEIAERQQVERERDRFFTLSLDMLCIANLDGYFTRLNPAWQSTLGYPIEELQRVPFRHFVHPEDQAATSAELEQLATSAPTIGFENRYRCKNGSYKWLAWTANVIVEEGLVYAIARDVTERKQAEQERLLLLAQEQAARAEAETASTRVTTILESITDAFFTTDNEWRFTYLNQQAALLLQRTREELLGENLWDEFPEAVGSSFDQEYHRAILEQVTVEFEAFFLPLSTWFEVHAYPTKDGLSVYFQNINDRKRSQEALRKSEERFQLITRATNDAVWDWDLLTNSLWWNEGLQTLFGYSATEVGTHANWWSQQIHPEDTEQVVLGIHAVIDSGQQQWSAEYRFRRADSSYAYVLDRGFVI